MTPLLRSGLFFGVLLLSTYNAVLAAPPKGHANVAACAKTRADTKIMEAILEALPDVATFLENPEANITVFMPTDDAFKLMYKALRITQEDMLADKDLLQKVLTYHVISSGAYKSTDIKKGVTKVATALEGYSVDIQKYSKDLIYVRAAMSRGKVKKADIPAGMAIVHIVDRVLVPFDVTAALATPSPSPSPSPESSPATSPESSPVPSPEPAPEPSPIAPVVYPAPVSAATLYDLVTIELPDGNTLYTMQTVLDFAGASGIAQDPNTVATVFAPTDAAFAGLLAQLDDPTSLVTDPTLLQYFMYYHIHMGQALTLEDMADGSVVPVGPDPSAYATQPAEDGLGIRKVAGDGDYVLAYSSIAKVLLPNNRGGKGIVHVIDYVLVPKVTGSLGAGVGNRDPPGTGWPRKPMEETPQ